MHLKFSSKHSKDDSKLLSENLVVGYRTMSIESVVSSFEESLRSIPDISAPRAPDKSLTSIKRIYFWKFILSKYIRFL